MTEVKEITKDSPIEVVLAFHDPKGTYSVNAGVVMVSIFEHTTSPVRIHILHDETLTEDNRKKFIRTAEKYGQDIEFHDMTERVKTLGPDILALAKKFSNWSIGMFFRLLIPDVITVDRVIYFDCDILVNLDIRELWDIELRGNCLAGVLDFTEHERTRVFSHKAFYTSLIGICLRDYINSGVLLMDLKKIREKPTSMLKTLPEWFARYGHWVCYPDMDFLNAFFCGSILHIPEKFNKLMAFNDYDDSAIMHIIDVKPWISARNRPSDVPWWTLYMKTAWGENMTHEEMFRTVLHATSLEPDLHSLSQSVVHWLKRNYFYCYRVLRFGFDLYRYVKTLINGACYWITQSFRREK